MTVFSISDIPEFSKKQRIVVVGVIGKSPYRYPNKATPLVSGVQSDENGIECNWDERRGVLYLHAVTYLDTKRLAVLAAELNENSKSTEKDADASHWLVASGELAVDSCQIIALLFQLCHIVVLSSPTSTFDLGYLQLFKAIDAYRTELAANITSALSEAKITGTWESHGRTCCPRLLFHFRRAPTPLRGNPAALKRLEHATEDQLYYILRKARIITNVCAKSLFAIPKNEEFVYISGDGEPGSARDISALVGGLVARCTANPPCHGGEALAQPAQGAECPGGAGAEPRASFRAFLQGHIERAAHDGFDDNVGKYAMTTSFFELPSAACWRDAARALAPLFMQQAPAAALAALHTALATDVRFSAARCAKVLPIAQASYAEGLPSHYSSQHHAHKVKVALGVVASMARGPLCAGAAARLRQACAAAYAERTLCEAPSLTGHGCVHPEHDSSVEHSSGVRYVGACDCGRTRAARDDPYTVRAANCAFYAAAGDQCDGCRAADRHAFPVFEPSTPTFRAASVKGGGSQEAEGGREWEGGSPGSGSGWSAEALSPGPAPDDDDDEHDQCVLHVRGDSANERGVSRQASTTEYLPGMLHAGSPAGLLPRAQHWSLLCLGASSLYSHALGLPEHLQPGFLPHTNYLQPWDCAPRVEQISLFRTALSRGRGKSAPPHITVKIFIGFEYECPRGHRFMMSSPEAVTSGGGSAAAGAALAAADMPVYVACVCRAAPAAPVASLARLHLVTPKAPLHVTIQPRVQPVPGGPIFVPHPVGSPPIKLSPSAYWILRLPYMYADERGPLPRPRTPPPLQSAGKILAPIFGLVE